MASQGMPCKPETGRVLIVDDEEQFAAALELILRQADFEVDLAADGLSGLRRAFQTKPDVVLVDIMMPRMDGWELCRRLRDVSEVPIVVISALGREQDIVKALELGADDYLVKPFGPAELLARVRALLRRAAVRKEEPNQLLRFGNVLVDIKRARAFKAGKELTLTPTERELLMLLAKAAGRVLPHTYIMRQVWGAEDAEALSNLRLYIRYLREKLEDDPDSPALITTDWGIGYRMRSPDDL